MNTLSDVAHGQRDRVPRPPRARVRDVVLFELVYSEVASERCVEKVTPKLSREDNLYTRIILDLMRGAEY